MRDCYIVRVFTRGDEGGNHLGVVTDVAGLTAETMQRIATELGFSETAFVQWDEGQSPWVRIFTPSLELPFAGHPLVGAAWVLSELGPVRPDRLLCGVGEVGLAVDGDMTWVETELSQRVQSLNDPRETSAGHGLRPARAARRVMMPLPYLILEYDEPDEVSSADPDMQSFGPDDFVYLCAWESESSVRARFFAPGSGVPEDPGTGSAAIALAAALQARGQSEGSLEIRQGDEIGHPSTIHLVWRAARGRIGGTVRQDEVRQLDY